MRVPRGRLRALVSVPTLGLRSRFFLALLLTSAVTIAVAAVGLLAPLERRLRVEEVSSLESTAITARTSVPRAVRERALGAGRRS